MTKAGYRHVSGYCPMGCGRTLFLSEGGSITCSLDRCPNPTALSDIINEACVDHIVTLEERDFSILHPLRERIDDLLLGCALHTYLEGLDGPPRKPGRYLVAGDNGGWAFEAIYETEQPT